MAMDLDHESWLTNDQVQTSGFYLLVRKDDDYPDILAKIFPVKVVEFCDHFTTPSVDGNCFMPKAFFPKYKSFEASRCFYCGMALSGPFQDSGYGEGNGKWKGQCSVDPYGEGCGKVTWFDLETEDVALQNEP